MMNIKMMIFLALVGAATLTGCAVKVAPVEPPVEMPSAFGIPAAVAEGKVHVPAGGAILQAEWWRSLGDPQLDALIEQALSGNFDLRSAFARLNQAEAVARRAGAPLYPGADLSLGRERRAVRSEQTQTISSGGNGQDGEGETQTRTTFDTDYTTEYNFGVSASFELDLWGRIRAARKGARLDFEASHEDLEAAAITLTGNVASTWYQLQEQQGQVTLLKAQAKTTSDTLKLIQYRFNQGLTSASDVLQQQQLLESRREETERALAQLRALEISLAILLGDTPQRAQIEAAGQLINLPSLPSTGIAAEAIAARPDVRSALLAVQGANQRVASAIADRYPRISLTAGYSTSSEDFSDLFDNWVANIASNLVAPLLDGGQRRAEVDRTRALALERFYSYGQTILNALGEVEVALNNEAQQMAIVASIERQLELARQVTDSLRAEYLRGGVEYLRVLDAQISQQNLERELLTARRQLIGFRIDLHRALASGWELKTPTNLRLENDKQEDKSQMANPGVEENSAEKLYPLPLALPGK